MCVLCKCETLLTCAFGCWGDACALFSHCTLCCVVVCYVAVGVLRTGAERQRLSIYTARINDFRYVCGNLLNCVV